MWLLSVVVFIILRMAPGDAAVAALARAPGEGALNVEQLGAKRRELGLDRAWPVQYAAWAADIARLDAGRSAATGLPVLDEIVPRLWVTAELVLLTLALVAALGLGLGGLAAAQRGRAADVAARALALVSLSAPAFWVGLLLIIAVASWTGIFIASSFVPLFDHPAANLRTLGAAALVLSIRPAALVARVVRVSTVDALAQDFVRAARARGLSERAVLWRHAFRSASLPALTVLGAEAVYLLGGSVVIEQLFGLPGIGRAVAAGVLERDYPLVQFATLMFGGAALTVNLVADVAYARLDPRVRLA